MKNVTIPAEYFFNMATKDYNRWESALIREFIQNSVDAGATEIHFTFDGKSLEIRDNGCGMSLHTIETALLTLGGSEKWKDSVGGLGKAKELLYFSWPEWEIHSRDHLIKGSGPQYSIDSIPEINGTLSKILVEDKLQYIEGLLISYCERCSFDEITITYNDSQIETSGMVYGEKIYTIDGLGDLYTLPETNRIPKIIVQSHGLFMFYNFSILEQPYVFNITMPSYDCLTSNRDGFVGEWQDQFSLMISKMGIDTQSTSIRKETVILLNPLKNKAPLKEIKKQIGEEGYKDLMRIAQSRQMDVTELDYHGLTALLNDDFIATENIVNQNTLEKLQTTLKATQSLNKNQRFDDCMKWYTDIFTEGFIIVTDMEINMDLVNIMYDVDTLKMTWLWKVIIDEIAEKLSIEKQYGFGLLMLSNPKCVAECRDGYLLYNPIPYLEMDWHEFICEMILNAAEELTHYLGFSYHNESFKCRFAEIIKAVLLDRLNSKDIYCHTKKVTRKNGIKG